ncbi:MAG: YciI family protein [Pseudomonadales bacterium]|nr:YciI family protein [Pseudomonadales bacterium]
MLYAIISTDIAESLPLRQKAREEHLARLRELKNTGRLFVAGPHPAIDTEEPGESGFSGSLIIAEFDSLEAARSWAEDDPYIKAGVYASSIVKPFKKVLP